MSEVTSTNEVVRYTPMRLRAFSSTIENVRNTSLVLGVSVMLIALFSLSALA
jgi:hypothetical protein